MKPRGIVIHHSLTKDTGTVSWDAIRKYHIETCGWADIGYHYGIELVGDKLMVLQGRPIDKIGAHTKDFNDSIGICCVGNFDVEDPSPEMLAKVVEVTVDVLEMFPHLTPANVFPHTKFAPYKSCPGKKFPWDSFIGNVWGIWREL